MYVRRTLLFRLNHTGSGARQRRSVVRRSSKRRSPRGIRTQGMGRAVRALAAVRRTSNRRKVVSRDEAYPFSRRKRFADRLRTNRTGRTRVVMSVSGKRTGASGFLAPSHRPGRYVFPRGVALVSPLNRSGYRASRTTPSQPRAG